VARRWIRVTIMTRPYNRTAGAVKRGSEVREALLTKRRLQSARLLTLIGLAGRTWAMRMSDARGLGGQSIPKPSFAPVAPADRLAALDILRGLALFGVMAINVVFEFRVSIFDQFLPSNKIPPSLDRTVEVFLDEFISLKAFALFSLLFGIGLGIQFDRLEPKRRAVLLVRRLVVLLAIGIVHLTFIWNGDILTEYALAGLFVLPFLFGPRWLLATSGLLFVGLYLTSYLIRLLPLADTTWLAEHILEARRVYGTGSFSEVLSFRIGELRAIAPLHVWVFPRTIAMFLLGAFIWRTGVLQRAAASLELLFGIALTALVLTIDAGRALSTVTLAFAHGAFIIAAASTQFGEKLLGWAAPLGRMAFTNYLAQSLIFGWAFYGHDFGLFGRLGASTALAFGAAVYGAQVIFSRWWLKRHNFGPVEWLWRTLMYGQLQPMKLSTAPAGQSTARSPRRCRAGRIGRIVLSSR
jgi:uncharacterized protein